MFNWWMIEVEEMVFFVDMKEPHLRKNVVGEKFCLDIAVMLSLQYKVCMTSWSIIRVHHNKYETAAINLTDDLLKSNIVYNKNTQCIKC